MSAVERVQAAIDKLTELKAVSTRGPWHEWTNDLTDRVELWHDQEVRLWVADLGNDEPGALADADLIVALHRTIDAQLAILERWLEYRPLTMEEPVVALADAILGVKL